MISITNKINRSGLALAVAMAILSSCNKGVEDIVATVPPVSGITIGQTIKNSPTDSLFYKLIVKGGLEPVLNQNSPYTVLVPDNAAMIASGLSNAVVNAMPAGTAASIVSYNIYPQLLPTTSFPTSFPNALVATLLGLDPTNPLVRMTSFPSKRGTQTWVNNVPLGVVDIAASNGIIHKPLAVVAPPSRLLKDTMDRVSNLTYYKAAIAKADSGQTGTNRFDSLRNYAVTNMTLLAPNDVAFQTLIYALVYGKVFAATGNAALANTQATGAVALGPAIFTNPAFYPDLAAANVRGIMAYHFLASNTVSGGNPTGAYQPNIRAFSVNFDPAGALVKTLVNGAVPVHPGIMAKATFTGPVVSTLTFSSYGTLPPGGAPFSYTATSVGTDRHAVNGVFHIIDKVLLPQ